MPYVPWILRYRWRLFWAVMPLGLVLLGLVILVHWLHQPNPRTITYRQLVTQPSIEGWYQVSGGFLDLNRRVRLPGDEEGDAYLALRGPGETGNSQIHVLVQENNQDIDDRITNLTGDSSASVGAGSSATPAKWTHALLIPATVIGQVDPLGQHYTPNLATLGRGVGPQTAALDETFSLNVWYLGPLVAVAGLLLWLVGRGIGVSKNSERPVP